jgi:lipoate-protein ligase B
MQCSLYWLGLIDFGEAYDIQKKLWSQKMNGRSADALLLLEHSPSFTIGKSGSLENLLLSKEELAQKGISLFFIDRGGDITYHGPGQLVVYPIVDLRNRGKDIHRYIHDLQEVVIRTLADLAIEAQRDGQHVGVWVDNDKIAAIGVRVSRWVTMHGLALNVNPVMEHFSYINPCGILDKGVTSISQVLSHDVPMETVVNRVAHHFSQVFDTQVEWLPADSLRCQS